MLEGLTGRTLGVIAALGSMALLLGALAFQYIGGLAPCPMCIWQRWPHGAAILAGVLLVAIPARIWPVLGAIAAATTGGIGVFHTGVERGWWQGPTTCTSGSIEGLSPDALMNQILAAPLVRCDEVAWQMFGLSMASWNAVLSFALAALWLLAATRRT